ncbi:hypothetical protein Nepgr_030259 [Nepenthes gracilis]|uniref:C2 domain-containing protein n=1 Tax=Nepenthes gracilis TaxID=150966 RepID=A0AAD3TGD5_NEPGR|nr:hypothetical protein Nepgr_030259 [Nepenthes gracilis]
MAYRTLEVTVLSANDLKKACRFSKMDLYVVVFLDGDSAADKHKTPIDRHGGTNPTWNLSVKFTIDELAAQQGRLTLVFHILRRCALGDRLVGEVHAPVKDLLTDADANAAATGSGVGKSAQFVSCQVRKPSGTPKGVLNFSYKFGDGGYSSQQDSRNKNGNGLGRPHWEMIQIYPGFVPMLYAVSFFYWSRFIETESGDRTLLPECPHA